MGHKTISCNVDWNQLAAMPKDLSAVFLGGRFTLQPEWFPLVNARGIKSWAGGLYALGFPQGVKHDGGISRIIYIGSTNDLRKRLMRHAAEPHNYWLGQFQQISTQGLAATYWRFPVMDVPWLRALEGEAICTFERVFGRVPACNDAVPDSPYAQHCKAIFDLRPCVGLTNSVPIEALPELIPNFRPKRRFYLGQGGPLDANMLFYMPPDEKRSREEWRARRAEELAAQHNLEHLATIWEKHVAAWSVKKFAAIMTICETLQAETKSRRTSVVRFLAPRSAVPLPHTWGEVALIKARIVCGSWRPKNRFWLKIIHGRTLLGQAMLESWGLRGEDKSDLPQNQRPRPTFWELRLEDGNADEWYERSLLDEVIEPMFLSVFTDFTA